VKEMTGMRDGNELVENRPLVCIASGTTDSTRTSQEG